jgi:predicted XRE-type DNA-binding protein
MHIIIIVGTSHTIQTTELKLKVFLEELCRKFSVRAVAEEMFEEALAEKDCAESIPMQVADALQIEHKFCDPNMSKRTELGIFQENQIRVQNWISNSQLSESEIAELVIVSHGKREQYWLEQLRSLNVWPVLFICGSNHVTSFHKLIEQQGFVAHIAADDWE